MFPASINTLDKQLDSNQNKNFITIGLKFLRKMLGMEGYFKGIHFRQVLPSANIYIFKGRFKTLHRIVRH